VFPVIICLVLAVYGKSKQAFGQSFHFCKSVPTYRCSNKNTCSTILDMSYSWFFACKPLFRSWNWNFDKRHGSFWVRRGIHEKSIRCLNFTSCLFKQVQGTKSFKYNEGNDIDVCFNCFMKTIVGPLILFLDEFGIESEVVRKTEYQWKHLIIVRWQNVTDTVACYTEVCLYEDAIGENPYKKLAGFPQHLLSSPVWSNYRPATAFSMARGSIQEKSSNLKFLEKRVRLHLSHWIFCAGEREFAQEQYFSVYHFVLFIYFDIKLQGTARS